MGSRNSGLVPSSCAGEAFAAGRRAKALRTQQVGRRTGEWEWERRPARPPDRLLRHRGCRIDASPDRARKITRASLTVRDALGQVRARPGDEALAVSSPRRPARVYLCASASSGSTRGTDCDLGAASYEQARAIEDRAIGTEDRIGATRALSRVARVFVWCAHHRGPVVFALP